MKPYNKQKEENKNNVSEPEALYGAAQQQNPLNFIKTNSIPEGYMTLNEFGELFHQKLETCYERQIDFYHQN